jgi:hypothetical protein
MLLYVASESTQLGILQELIGLLPTAENTESTPKNLHPLNANQIQVVIVEISNLVVALGEAAGSKVDELKSVLENCIGSSNIGIRYETAMLCVAVASKFPIYGMTLITESIEDIQQKLAQTVGSITSGEMKGSAAKEKNPVILRTTSNGSNPTSGVNVTSECAILGRSLLISMLIKATPVHSGGLPRSSLASVLEMAEILVSSQFNELLSSSNSSMVCSFVRAGFAVISGVLTTGPDAVEAHMSQVVNAWKKTVRAAKDGCKRMSPAQDLSCIESALTSIAVFLKYCSELLLIIPEALSQISMFLEEIFPLLQATGRLGTSAIEPRKSYWRTQQRLYWKHSHGSQVDRSHSSRMKFSRLPRS